VTPRVLRSLYIGCPPGIYASLQLLPVLVTSLSRAASRPPECIVGVGMNLSAGFDALGHSVDGPRLRRERRLGRCAAGYTV
jgi:hypothetical protein